MSLTSIRFTLPLALLVLAACSSPGQSPGSAVSTSGGSDTSATQSGASGGPAAPTDQVRDDIPSPGTRSNAEITQSWEGLGSTGGATGTGVGVGTTATPPRQPGPR